MTAISSGRLCDACHAANAVWFWKVLDLAFCEHHASKHRQAIQDYMEAKVQREAEVLIAALESLPAPEAA